MAQVLVNNVRGNKVTETLEFVMENCCNCGVPFFMPAQLNKQCRNDPEKYFYCPNGHVQHYSKSESQKQIDELNSKLRAQIVDKENVTEQLLETISEKNKLSRQLKRVHKGVCPCCNRTFDNLQQHMKTKHPLLGTL